MKQIYIWGILFTAILPLSTAAQFSKSYEKVDQYVEQLGPLSDLNMATITDTITEIFSQNKEKARAIYYWITHQIALDPKAIRANDNSKTEPEGVIRLRKSTAQGIAKLYQEMASQADLRCLTVDGYTKKNAEDIGEAPDELNHTWNVVQLGKTSTEWFYVDAAKGCGSLDKKRTTFIKNYTSGYFFTERKIFNHDHYPDNAAWQLGEGPGSLNDFNSLPVINAEAYDLGLSDFLPRKGKIKTKVNATFQFNFRLSPSAQITILEMQNEEGNKKTAPKSLQFTNKGGDISFTCIFYDADEFPITIFANGKALITYMMEVTE